MNQFSQFLTALIITVVIETLILYLLTRNYFKINKSKISNAKIIFAGFVSFGTLPYVWFVLPSFFGSYNTYVFVSEMAVWLAEAVFYHFALEIDWKKALAMSFVCNLVSAVIGLWIYLAI